MRCAEKPAKVALPPWPMRQPWLASVWFPEKESGPAGEARTDTQRGLPISALLLVGDEIGLAEDLVHYLSALRQCRRISWR